MRSRKRSGILGTRLGYDRALCDRALTCEPRPRFDQSHGQGVPLGVPLDLHVWVDYSKSYAVHFKL